MPAVLRTHMPFGPAVYSRFIRFKHQGKNEEEIAKEDGVTVRIVQQAIRTVELYRAMCNMQELEAGETGIIMSTHMRQQKILNNALEAERYVRDAVGNIVRDPKGKPLVEPDWEVRLKAQELLNDKVDNLQPKGKGSTTSVTVGVGVGVQAPGASQALTYEDRLRVALQRRQQNQLQGAVIEAETVPEPGADPA